LRRAEVLSVLARGSSEHLRERGHEQQRSVLYLEPVGAPIAEGAGDETRGEVVARPQGPRPSVDAPDRLPEKIRRQDDDGAIVTGGAGMADAVLLVGSDDECRGRVDDHGLPSALDDEDAATREDDLRDAAYLE